MRKSVAALVACVMCLGAVCSARSEELAPAEIPDEPPPTLVKPLALLRDGVGAGPVAPQLQKFRQRLADLKAGRTARVTILQIGDSHTAADQFSGRLRARFQLQFGNAGRGQLAPGVPAPYWRPTQVRAEQTGKWEVFTSNKDGFERLPYGLSGYVLRGKDTGDTMSLAIGEDEARFASVVIGYYRRSGGGSFTVSVDGVVLATVSTDGGNKEYVRQTVQVPSGHGRQLTLRLKGDGSVDLGEWGLYRKATGVEYISHGFVGAQVTMLERWDEQVVAQQLAELDPALILLVFGTNEGYAAAERLKTYAQRLEARVAALEKAAPNASIVLVAAPDANRIPKFCAVTGEAAERKTCRPLTPSEVGQYSAMMQSNDKELCRWHTPASYMIVRAAQQEVAQRHGAYWWDWATMQGGFCSASAWYAQGLAHKDRVHLKREGAWRSADMLFAQLVRGVRTK